MKAKYLLIAIITLSIFACDDNSGTLGLEMFPGSDQNIIGKSTTFNVTTQSEIADNVFAKTSIGYLGRFTDPNFGYYEASFLSQIHCIEDFKFPPVCNLNDEDDVNNPEAIMVSNEIYRTELVLTYTNYFGDSLAPQHVNVYQLNQKLDKQAAYYTNINPSDYYSSSDLIGDRAYTAVNLAHSDSLRATDTYLPSVVVSLPTSLGQEIYNKSREAEANNKDFAPIFMDMFKGIYVTNDYGDGTILYIDQIELNIVFKCYIRDSSTGEIYKMHDEVTDSTGYSYRTFVATKEIIQANSFKSDETLIQQKVEETDWTYLKTPAGIYTQATLPLTDFEENLSQDTLNVVKLAFTSYNQSNDENKYEYTMNAPSYLLMVREKNKESFFINNEINDGLTSYIATRGAVYTNQYLFPNISQLINICLAEKAAAVEQLATFGEISEVLGANGQPVKTIEEWIKYTMWDKVALIPVNIVTDSNGNVVGILNDLQPGYTKLKGGLTGSKLDLDVIYTSFGNK